MVTDCDPRLIWAKKISRWQLRATEPRIPNGLHAVLPATVPLPANMSATLHQRGVGNGAARHDLLHVLEDLQSRIHSDPNDKPDAPPEKDPSTTDALTLTWHEIPAWQKDNEYILTGYRRWVGGSAGSVQVR